MKSIIILKGLVKSRKIDWVRKEGLKNYLLDIRFLKSLYSAPELIKDDIEILGRSFGSLVYQRFVEILCTRLSKGCLVVVDLENDPTEFIEFLAIIYGYTVFYVIQEIPQDYIINQKKYDYIKYLTKTKEDLSQEVSSFLNLQLDNKLKINSFSDVEDYWVKKYPDIKISNDNKILHISDIHSNFELLSKIPNNCDLKIFHGDYIDGNKIGGSKKMIDYIINCNDKKVIWLEGNHELRLRKYLGYLILKDSSKRKEIKSYLYSTLPIDFLNTTAKEFENLNSTDAAKLLKSLNNILRTHVVLKNDDNDITYICTHSGLRLLGQISPKYIGNVIYGNRDMDKYDKEFSFRNKDKNIVSVHAHCKYPNKWDPVKYKNIINIDPIDENEIVIAEQTNNNWNICQIRSEE